MNLVFPHVDVYEIVTLSSPHPTVAHRGSALCLDRMEAATHGQRREAPRPNLRLLSMHMGLYLQILSTALLLISMHCGAKCK
jgi:hypothetical protein